MAYLAETQCCGIRELDEIQDTSSGERAVLDAAEDWFGYDNQRAFIFYSTVRGTRGEEITQYIRKHRLGVVKKMPPTMNGNTDNLLTMWVWAPNKQNFERWWIKNKPSDSAEW